MNNECIICDEPIETPSELDSDICLECADEAESDTDAELTELGIDPDDSPIIRTAEVMRRIG